MPCVTSDSGDLDNWSFQTARCSFGTEMGGPLRHAWVRSSPSKIFQAPAAVLNRIQFLRPGPPARSHLKGSHVSTSTSPSTRGRRSIRADNASSNGSANGSHAGIPSPAQRGAAIRAAYRGRFTQVQLAEILGVAQNTISRWSTGDVEPSLDDLVRLEETCGLPRGHILRSAGYVSELASAEDFIAADHRLDPVRRELLLSAYFAALEQSQR